MVGKHISLIEKREILEALGRLDERMRDFNERLILIENKINELKK